MSRCPLVALVGRPNVGKSTLFNRLVGKRQALVDDHPGVTRDRLFGEARLGDRRVRVVDTGGFDLDVDDPLITKVLAQTQLAIDEADLAVVVLDGVSGLRAEDGEVVDLLRRSNKKMLGVVNKIDSPSREADIAEFYRLGIDQLFGISAEHGRGFPELC